MPCLILPSRRELLGSVLASTALLRGASAEKARWAFLSDTHIPANPANGYRGFRPHDNLRAVVSEVVDAAPEGAVIAGDLARTKGLPEDYKNLKTLLRPLTEMVPTCMALGNHDDRKNFLAAFAKNPGYRQYVRDKFILSVDAGPMRFILLDSLMESNFAPGLLGKSQRIWLDEYLNFRPAKPTILFVHHTLDDSDTSLLDVGRMFRIIQPYKMVKAVVYGHSHFYRYDSQDGIQLINLPAVGYNFRDSEPVGWLEATLTAEGGDFKLHSVGGNKEPDGKIKSLSWRT